MAAPLAHRRISGSLTTTTTSHSELARLIWSLAWPVILTMSLEAVVGLVDMIMVGRLGPTPVAGVGVAMQILFAVHTVMFAVGTGTIALIARRIGAGEIDIASRILGQSILVVLVLVVAVVGPVAYFAPQILAAFNVEDEVVAVGVPFLRVLMIGLPADAIIIVGAFALRGAGDTRTPLAVSAVVNLVTVAGNYVLIFGKLGLPAMGATGAALGNVCAYFIGAWMLLYLLTRGGLVLALPRGWWRPDLTLMRQVVSIGYPSALEHILMQLGFFFYFVFAAEYETSAVAAYVIGVRILGLSFLPGFGFAAAASTLVGQNLGAGQPEQAARSGFGATVMSIVMMSLAGLVIYLAAEPVARLFVDDPIVIAKAVSFIHVLAAAQPLMAIDFTLGGALRGAGDTRFPLVAVLLGFYVCRLGTAYAVTFVFHLDLFWLWFALVPDFVMRCVLKSWRFHSRRWQTIRI